MEQWVEPIALGLEAVGVVVIVVGAVAATVIYLRDLWPARRGLEAYNSYRRNLGRAILLGLEFLVAGDIIATILVEATLNSVLALGLIVLIRTFLSFSLETELEGRLPWRQQPEG